MKGLFCFDGPLYRDIEGNYCSNIIVDEVLQQFLDIVDKLYIAIRVFEIHMTWKESGMHKISTNKISIISCRNLNSPKTYVLEKKNQKKELEDAVKNVDMIFLRLPSILSNIVVQLSEKYNKKIFAEVVGCAWDSYWNHSLFGKLAAFPLFIQQKQSVARVDIALYVTEKFLQQRYPNFNKSYGYSDVILPTSSSNIEKNRLNQIKIKENKSFLIGTAAAVNVKYKGQQYVIKAIAELVKEGYQLKYEMVGDGEPRYLKKLVKKLGLSDNIKFVGAVKHEEVFDWLDTIDIYIQPSRQEGMPRALLEAMSRGCPALGTRTGGIPEVLAKKYLVRNGNILDFKRKIKYIINEDGMLERMAKENLQISKKFQLERLNICRKQAFDEYMKMVLKNENIGI